MRCIIIEDERMAREGLEELVQARDELELLASFDGDNDVMGYVVAQRVELVFLDIEMPGMNGMEFARRLPDRCAVIFTTAFPEYGAESYDVDAVDFLTKPIHPDRFDKAVDKALARHAVSSRGSFVVKSGRRYVRLEPSEIIYAESIRDRLIIHLADRDIDVRMPLKTLETRLRGASFLRISNSFIVNINKVSSFDSSTVFIAGQSIPVGITYREAVIKALLEE